MTYSESAKGVKISKARALKELAKHGINDSQDIEQFFAEMGNKDEYDAHEVLCWLGY